MPFSSVAKEWDDILEFVVIDVVDENRIGQFPNGVGDAGRTNAEDNIWNFVVSCNVPRNHGESKEVGLAQGRLESETHRVSADRVAVVMAFDNVMYGILHFVLKVKNHRE